MPIQSKAQFRAMQAAAHGKSTLGIPASVGKEFAEAGPAGGSFKKLPEKKKQSDKMKDAVRRGRVSNSVLRKRGYEE